MTNSEPRHTPFYISSIILFCVVVAGIWAVFALTKYEKKRDLNNWRITLGVMADSRANAVNDWTENRFSILRELSINGSLQLYTQQIIERPEINQEAEPAQLSYLRNLLTTTAQRGGFDGRQPASPPVKANIAFHADNGITLFSGSSEIITSTPGVTQPDINLKKAVQAVIASGEHAFFDMHLNANNQPTVGFLVPVFALQKQSGEQLPIAVLYGFQNTSESLFPILDNRGLTTETAETILVKKANNLVVYLTPLADKTPAMKRSLAANTDHLLSAYALKNPGQFGQGPDYAGTASLFTSRTIGGPGWTLVQKISRKEALAESNTHQRFLFITLLLALLLCSSLIVAAWWHGSSIREKQTTYDLQIKSSQLEAQTSLLNAINDNMTDYVMLLDHEKKLIFANRALAHQLSTPAKDLSGKSLQSIFGPDNSKQLHTFINVTLLSGIPVNKEIRILLNEQEHIFHAVSVQVNYEYNAHPAILITLNDVTTIQEAQTRKERLMGQIISALMRAIDLHDPYSANHSAKTTKVALAIAHAMGMKEKIISTIGIAANLCNLGKLSIPRELLLKTEPLTAEEQEVMRGETVYASDILANIDFEGAVQETISQKNELLDGSGYPNGIQGDDIILPARILTTANSFVAMISPRAYRDRLGEKEALMQLLNTADTKYDRQVVAALFHVVENKKIKNL
ncbi:MAG: PAS domain S-box protein [Desulfobulbaceae bacterium]|uniref:PAS domain S-box protein n=1 Tax=Candidatus Desulfobia pelagia TaxID=2841692 RepID=A0A8J6TG68_9BACT|nr:PAS domain S-box protein [Candidatus Desulfobia pelagia]